MNTEQTTETQTELTASQVSMQCELLISESGTIRIIPNKTDPATLELFRRGQVEICSDIVIASGVMGEWPIAFFGARGPGFSRWIGNHQNMFLAIGNPIETTYEDGSKSYSEPTALGDLIVNNLIAKGTINEKPLPVFSTMTTAKKSLAPGKKWVTPDGYVRQTPETY